MGEISSVDLSRTSKVKGRLPLPHMPVINWRDKFHAYQQKSAFLSVAIVEMREERTY